jgi:hypothetical protein
MEGNARTAISVTKHQGLTSTGLKWIALLLMILDHIHYMFGFTEAIPDLFSMLGRLAAPLFLFCLVEGFSKTRNRKKYFLKIYLVSVLMSALLVAMNCFGLLVRPDGFYPFNGMMTAFAILLVVYQGIDWLTQRRILRGLLAVALPLAAPFLFTTLITHIPSLRMPLVLGWLPLIPTWNSNADACLPVLLTGIVLYIFRKNRHRQVAAFVVMELLYDLVFVGLSVSQFPDFHWSQMFTTYYEWYGVFAAIPMLLYNGQRGGGHKAFFYVFYPAHIYALYALSWVYILLH